MKADAYQLLGLAQAARKIVVGDSLAQAIRQQKVALVIVAGDASLRTQKVIKNQCAYYNVNYQVTATKHTLARAIGKTEVAAVGIIDAGLAKQLLF